MSCIIYIVSFLVWNHLAEEESWLLTLVVFLLLCGCWSSMSLPHGALGWTAEYDCGISWSYSLKFQRN